MFSRSRLVIDVWMCTASSKCLSSVRATVPVTPCALSVLNLCAISVDRYLAVTQPVRYRSLMTAKRAKYIIAAVWILSFIICFPMVMAPFSTISGTLIEQIVLACGANQRDIASIAQQCPPRPAKQSLHISDAVDLAGANSSCHRHAARFSRHCSAPDRH